MRYILQAIAATIALATSIAAPAAASEIVYHPVNPTFGGNPLNGTPLLSIAQAQGEGVKSGSQGPDLSGLSNALSGLGSAIVINPTTTTSGTTNGSTVP